MISQEGKILFVGDSHIIHCFSKKENNSWYIVDITLNKIRQHGCDLKVNNLGYRDNDLSDCYEINKVGDSLVDIINNSDFDSILFSVGEIDIRYHLIDQLDINTKALSDIINTYGSFLEKIKKKIIICSILPPGIDNSNNHTKQIQKRSEITIIINKLLLELCEYNNYTFFDIYSKFNDNGFLMNNKSDGSVHVNKIYKNEILSDLFT